MGPTSSSLTTLPSASVGSNFSSGGWGIGSSTVSSFMPPTRAFHFSLILSLIPDTFIVTVLL